MYAIVEIAGQQHNVQPSSILTVEKIHANVGEEVTFSNVLFADNDGKLSIGAPYIAGSVKAKILAHGKGDKVIVFKKKRRKGYRKKNGHRQQYTQIQISDITVH